jgi:hypothetical protein
MPSILDIAEPAGQDVEIARGAKVLIRGLAADVWAGLYQKHPALVGIVQGGLSAQDISTGDAETVFARMMSMLALIGAATAVADGAPWDSEPHMAAAQRLDLDEILTLAGEVIKRSYPAEYMVPLRAALANGHAAPDGRAPATS